jgi:phosphoglucan,water dikinase
LEAAASETQELWLADIGLEDFAFVELSRLINRLADGRELLDWPAWIEAMSLALNHLLLSGIEPGECAAIISESQAWDAALNPGSRDDLLRLKATVDRARRLAEDYRDQILGRFAGPAEYLGRALNVPPKTVRAFCEGDIRAHVVFQISKLTSGLRQHLRERLALPPWDVLSAGTAEGRLITASRLEELERAEKTPVILLLRQAAGDEDIPSAVRGLILAHDLPHLSHLAVRARQAGVVLATCAETDRFEELAALAGRAVRLHAAEDTVDLTPAGPTGAAPKPRPAPPLAPVALESEANCLPLDRATVQNAGGKATGLRQLAELASRSDAVFRVPQTLVVPFGVMDASVAGTGGLAAKYHHLVEELAAAATAEAADRLAQELRAVVGQVPVPEEILERAAREFGAGARLMVRSSSNAEDLPGLAGAGLYESVANVALPDLADAIRRVWASLWSRAAVQSRRATGILPSQARMAVVLQPTLAPDLSFVLHTVHPITLNEREVYVEATVGLGETLVSGAARGYPYRLVCDKDSGEHVMQAFANFSRGRFAAPQGGLDSRLLDYSQVPFSCDGEIRRQFARRVAKISRVLEEAFGHALDVEGAVVGGEFWLLQARPQQGIGPGEESHG